MGDWESYQSYLKGEINMALDMAKMKAKLAELESGGKAKKDNVFWKPSEGDQDIRIVPTEDGDPFKVSQSRSLRFLRSIALMRSHKQDIPHQIDALGR